MQFIIKKQIKFPKRKNKKGENGRVLIIGGSKDYAGCLALAGIAALRSGVDWVTIAAPSKVAWAINALSADLVTKKFDCDYFSNKHTKKLTELAKNFDAILVGNGLTTRKETKAFVKNIINKIKKPLVIDADAIKAIKIQDVNNAILTPHKKEYEILFKNSKTNNIQEALRNNIIILKGPIDKIITKNKVYYNKTGNKGMTKAGTGDVLAGLCVGFLAQTNNLLQSAINATYINGLAGDSLKKKKGYSYIASDLLEEIKRLL